MRKLKPTSNASHQILKFSSLWFSKNTCTRLSYRKISTSGRSAQGHRILRTRGRLINVVKLPRVSYSFRLTHPLVVSTFKVVPFSHKILMLLVLPCGGVAYLPSLDSRKIFSITYFKTLSFPSWYKKPQVFITLIATVQQYRRISNIELWPGKGIQYARSAGTWGKITNRDFNNYTAVAYLPSGVRKIVSIFSLVVPGRCAGIDKRLIKNTKSGFWRSFGFKPTVRGVAMNPIDHPHGGRTKSIKYPRTPWGKTTKFK